MLRFFAIIFSCFLYLSAAASAAAQGEAAPPEQRAEKGPPPGLELVQHGGYPELRVDGQAFFVHSAAFFYYRIPHNTWERSLDLYKELGINTIDLYIPWNWHEPQRGQLDLDGRTHPRRNLRSLLQLIADKGFKLIARPGPVILNEWRHGGYPEWLLERPEFGMPLLDRLEGRYPPLAVLNARDAEAAAQAWMENSAHMEATAGWFAAVARELAPFSFRRRILIPVPDEKRRGETVQKETSGPLLFVQIEDDYGLGRTNTTGPAFWRYAEAMRRMVAAGGLDVPVFINPVDFRVPGAGSAQEHPIGIMGQWYLQPPPPPAAPAEAADGVPTARTLTALDATNLEFTVETLKTQPGFPPLLIEYQAGWYTPGDDWRPLDSHPANTLLSSRLLLAHGLKGLNYFPLQDTLTPAGYSTPWTSQYYRWDAALSLSGERQARARSAARNGQLMELWGGFLASAAKRADFGLVHPTGSFAQEKLAREDVQLAARTTLRLLRLGQLAGLSLELLDPQHQPVEQLLRHAAVLLPVLDPAEERFQLSERAQRTLVEYVRRGGTLIAFPARPAGEVIAQLWTAGKPLAEPRRDPAAAVARSWSFGEGQWVESTKEFLSWIALEEDFAENRARMEAGWAIGVLHEFRARAGLRPVVRRAEEPSNLLVTQLATHAGSRQLSRRQGGRGLLSVTNLSYAEAAEESLEILSPEAAARSAGEGYIPLRVAVPPRESLLLPLHFSLCAAARPQVKCDDEIVAAGAELLGVQREGRTLELRFYAPARATLLLKLAEQPRRVELDEIRPEANWNPGARQLSVEIMRGAAPDFVRVVKIFLRYTPHVPEKPGPKKPGRRDFDFSVVDALRLPLGEDASLPADPPLLLLDSAQEGRMVVQAQNHDQLGRDLDIRVEGPVRGSASLGLDGGEIRHAQLTLRPGGSPAGGGSDSGGNGGSPFENLLRGELQVRAGRDRRTSPVYFAVLPEKGPAHYQFDFDRDGANEWVLEDAELRLMVSPGSGGRALALVDKSTGLNLTTIGGLARDYFAYTPNPAGGRPDRARGAYGLFNRPYEASWARESSSAGLRLRYTAPDVYPAGAAIEKILRLDEAEALEVEYKVELLGGGEEAGQEQAFVAVHAVPALVRGDRGTRFCWRAQPEAERQCELFVPGRVAGVPEGVTRLEVETPGRSALRFRWEGARAAIEMKQHTALLRLRFPALVPGGEAGRYRTRIEVLPAP